MRTALLTLMLFLLMPLQASAMSCMHSGSERSQVRRAFADSTVVFSGYVLDVGGEGEAAVARVQVLQVWKGTLDVGQVVETSAHEGALVGSGIVPTAGTAMLIYAGGDSPYFLHTCSRTMELDSATGDIPLLNDLSRRPRYRLGG